MRPVLRRPSQSLDLNLEVGGAARVSPRGAPGLGPCSGQPQAVQPLVSALPFLRAGAHTSDEDRVPVQAAAWEALDRLVAAWALAGGRGRSPSRTLALKSADT